MVVFHPLYHVRSRSELEELQQKWERLLTEYSFVSSSEYIDVEKDEIEGSIDLSPKKGEIEKIVLVGRLDSPARVLDTSSIGTRIVIGETFYRVYFSEKTGLPTK